MKILIITDAWHPQVNGVVRTYEHLSNELIKAGHEVELIGPSLFPLRFPMPGYKEIELTLFPYKRLKRMIKQFEPDTIHIGTEGPLGWAARKYCKRHNKRFSTFYHTQFPDYVAKRFAKSGGRAYRWWQKQGISYMRQFHNASSGIMTTTKSIEDQLKAWKFLAPTYRIPLSANLEQFSIGQSDALKDTQKPIALYVGRVAIEKNLEAFLKADWQGSKVIIGNGPEKAMLEKKYPSAHFLGRKTGQELANIYRAADLFVFPSKTDTFGIVMIEALACGVPVAAYNVTGPRDIITEPILGALHDTDLSIAIAEALKHGTPEQRSKYVQESYSWLASSKQFLTMLQETALT